MGLIKRGRAWNRAQAGSRWSPRHRVVVISVMVLAFVLYTVGVRAAQEPIVDWGGKLHVTEQVSVDASTPLSRGGRECTIVGTRGDDRLRGTRRDDVICALAGDDLAFGRRGSDTLILGPGNDLLGNGGPGDDVIRGGGGRDGPYGSLGNDRMYGQRGSDFMADYWGMDLLSGGTGDDQCLNAADDEGGDVIRGGRGRDRFFADNGDEVYSAEVKRLTCG